jgi:hypothetical protein
LPHDKPLPAGLTAGLPPVSAIEEIKEYARSLDLVFQ